MSRKISSEIIKKMAAAGWLRVDAYSLREGFADEPFEVLKVEESRSRNAEDDENDNFRIRCRTKTGVVSVPGSVILNSYVLPNTDGLKKESSINNTNVFYDEDISEVIASAQRFHEIHDTTDSEFEFDEKLHVVGAIVSKDPDIEDAPRFPLRAFKYYSQVRRHHLDKYPEDTFVTRDDFKMYVGADTKPEGIPANAKFELLDSVKKADMKNWMFTLLLADKAE